MVKQIDPLVHSLRGHDDFVRMYDTNRKVIDLGHRYTQFKGLSVAKGTQTTIMGVEIEFRNANGSVKVTTDVNGKYRELLNPDVYDMIATHPLYETFTIEGLEIHPGEIKIENLELVPKS